MFARLAIRSDEDAIIEMAAANIAETRPTLEFDEARARATFRSYLERADPTFFVIDDKRDVIAMLACNFYEHRAATGLFTTQEVLYVRPDRRGSRAAALLMKQLIAWSTQLGATEIIGGNDNEFNSERTARFLEHFGFARVGFTMRRELRHVQEERR